VTERIMAVDAEPAMRRLLKGELEAAGFRVLAVTNGKELLGEIGNWHPDLVILASPLEDLSAEDLMRQIEAPILSLSELPNPYQRAQLMDAGADAVLSKPISTHELIANVKALLRRTLRTPDDQSIVRVANLEVDLAGRVARVDGVPAKLTRTEWLVLQELAVNAGRVVLSRDLLLKYWGDAYRENFKYLRVWISRLRAKIGDDPKHARLIRTAAGVGYRLALDGEEPAEEEEDE
jgi:two-component system KDP operon response regulator KdpE